MSAIKVSLRSFGAFGFDAQEVIVSIEKIINANDKSLVFIIKSFFVKDYRGKPDNDMLFCLTMSYWEALRHAQEPLIKKGLPCDSPLYGFAMSAKIRS